MNTSDRPPESAAWAAFLGRDTRSRASLEICQGSACREVGNEELLASLERLSGLRRGRPAADGSLTLIAGICQGRCAISPNARLNGCPFSVEGPSQAGELLKRALESGL